MGRPGTRLLGEMSGWARPDPGTLEIVADKVWTAEELEAMTPAEVDAIFEASLITDLAEVPEDFLERVRSRTSRHIVETETGKQ